MAIVSKMTRCAACGSTAVTYSEGTKLYRCADCGAERPDSMPATDLAAVNSILALGDAEGKLDELRRRYPNLDITSWSRENRVQMGGYPNSIPLTNEKEPPQAVLFRYRRVIQSALLMPASSWSYSSKAGRSG